MTRAMLKSIARVVAAVLLLAQLAVTAYACPWTSATARAAAAEAQGADGITPGCTEPMAVALDPAAPNLCAEHCKFGQQSSGMSAPGTPPLLLTALYLVAPLPPEAVPPPHPAAASISALVAASPPHAIAHCVLRI
jgi:hypothetical protein